MAYQHKDVIEAQYQVIAAERARALADYEAGRLSEDDSVTMSAANAILEADQKRMALDRIAQNFVANQQAPAGNKYGLSESEVEIARGMAGADKTLSDDAREQIYAREKNRLRQMRATGQYRDDQGTVRR